MKQTQNTNAPQHTPGKWTAFAKPEKGCYEGQDAPYTIRCGDRAIATVRQQVGAKANANLMAAAPELLAALECALADLEGLSEYLGYLFAAHSGSELDDHPAKLTITEARAAIAKARGLDT